MDAIRLEEQVAGRWFRSDTRFGSFFQAHLFAGQENSTQHERAKSLPSAGGGGRFRPTSPLCPSYRIYSPLVPKSAG